MWAILTVDRFSCGSRSVSISTAGKVFLAEMQTATTALDQAITRAQEASRGEIGKLVVVVNTAIANSLLPDILRTFRNHYPNVELELKSMTIEEMIQGLRDASVDIGFEHLPNPYSDDKSLNFLPIVQESFVVALPEQHRLATRSLILQFDKLQSFGGEPTFRYYHSHQRRIRCYCVNFSRSYKQLAQNTKRTEH